MKPQRGGEQESELVARLPRTVEFQPVCIAFADMSNGSGIGAPKGQNVVVVTELALLDVAIAVDVKRVHLSLQRSFGNEVTVRIVNSECEHKRGPRPRGEEAGAQLLLGS